MLLGDILLNYYGWPPQVISQALSRQSVDMERKRLGHYLREAGLGEGRLDISDVERAALLQDELSSRQSAGAEFDRIEYQELGRMLLADRDNIWRKIRTYLAINLTVLLYIAYPLNRVLDNPAFSGQMWDGIFILYAVVGVAMVAFAMCMGDDAVKCYGAFLKRRLRISRSRSMIRGAAQEHMGATRTLMPNRLLPPTLYFNEHHKERDSQERPDPEITGLQWNLPLYYSVWSVFNLCFLAYFASCLFQGGFRVGNPSLLSGLTVVALFAPVMIHFWATLCEKYKKYLLEAIAMSPKTPFPRISTTQLRDSGVHRKSNSLVMYSVIGLWIMIVAAAAVHFSKVFNSQGAWKVVPPSGSYFSLFLMFVVRLNGSITRIERAYRSTKIVHVAE